MSVFNETVNIVILANKLPKLLKRIKKFIDKKIPTNYGGSVTNIIISFDGECWVADIYFYEVTGTDNVN